MLSSCYVLFVAALCGHVGHCGHVGQCGHEGQCAGGYLDAVVQYRKHKFIEALKQRLPPINFNGPLPPIPSDVEDKDTDVIHITVPHSQRGAAVTDLVNITARIVPQPAGFKDHPKWDVASVGRLLDLLRVSKSGRRVLRTLRRSMQPSRRWMLSKQLSYKLFPNVNEGNYYESDNEAEYYTDEEENQYPQMMGDFTEDSVVIVANPVEARLPSGHISIAMLRKIMEQRAEAGRVMPSTTVATVTWRTKQTSKGGKATTEGGGGGEDADAATSLNGTSDDVTADNETTDVTGDETGAGPSGPNGGTGPSGPNGGTGPSGPNGGTGPSGPNGGTGDESTPSGGDAPAAPAPAPEGDGKDPAAPAPDAPPAAGANPAAPPAEAPPADAPPADVPPPADAPPADAPPPAEAPPAEAL